MDGPLHLTRVVRKDLVSVADSDGATSTVQVDCLTSDFAPRELIGVLCNDILISCEDSSELDDPDSKVELWAVLRMQTDPQPASVANGNSR